MGGNEMDEMRYYDNEPLQTQDTPDVPEGFTITDPTLADWAIETIKDEQKLHDVCVSVARDKIAKQEAIIRDADTKLQAKTAFLQSKLREWFESFDTRRETKTQYALDLPSGKLILTKPKRDYRPDKAKLLTFVKANAPQYIKVEESVKWGELKKTLKIVGDVAVTGDGMVVDGVEIVDVPAKFEII